MDIRLGAGLATVLLLAGCATDSEPRQNSDLTRGDFQQHIVVGETTKADVLDVFGAPERQYEDLSGETWRYRRSGKKGTSESNTVFRFCQGGTEQEIVVMTIKFDKNGVVRSRECDSP